MKKRLGKLPLLLGICILGLLILTSVQGRNLGLDKNNLATRFKKGLKGNTYGTNPGTSPDILKIIDGNRGTDSENKPYDTLGIGTTPKPENTQINITGKAFVPQSGFDMEKSRNISIQLAKFDEIKQINTVVNKDTALVGYSHNSLQIDANNTRNKITQRVKQLYPSITSVIVSDSADISSRIGRLWDDVRNNKSLNDLNNDFNQLKKDINADYM